MPKFSDVFKETIFPTRKIENWKYTPLNSILNTSFDIHLNPISHENQKDLINSELNKDVLSNHPFALLALNYAESKELIHIKESCSSPIHIRCEEENNKANFYHKKIIIEENVQADIIFEHDSLDNSPCFSSFLIEIILEKNASLSFYKKQSINSSSFLFDFILVNQKENSFFNSFTLDKGAALSRTDFLVHLNAPYAKAHVQGAYITQEKQIADHHSLIYHHAPYCQSKEHYRGIAKDQSKGIFNGKIVIEKQAQKSVTEQLNKNLLLSNQAEIDTKPELEIYADDVKASHGATIGQLDKASLFYLQARGLSLDHATFLLMHGFLTAVFSDIKNKEIQDLFWNNLNDLFFYAE